MKRIALLLLLVTATAHADSRAWTAAKAVLPDGLQGVLGINAAPIRSSQIYAKLWPMLMAQAGGAQTMLDRIKTTCKIDLVGQIDSVVVGMNSDDKGLIVLALKGTTQKDVEKCLTALSKEDGKPIKMAVDNGISSYTGNGPDIQVKWLTKDIVAMATESDNKDLLKKLLVGGNKLKPTKTDAAVWASIDKEQDIAQLHAKMSRVYGYADLKSSNLSAEVHVVLDDAKVAKDAATQMTKQIDEAKQTNQLPPALSPLIKTLAVKASGPEVVMTGSMAESDAIALISAVAAMLGH